jgi:hypothetical protein
MGTPGGQASLRGGEEQLYSLRLATAARHSLPPTTSNSSMAYQALTHQAVLFARKLEWFLT